MKKEGYLSLITDLASFIEQGRKLAVRYVNTAMVVTYWLIGRRIVEYEQKGKERARYGQELLQKLSQDLNRRFGRGFSTDNLEAMRHFYLSYPVRISETVSRKLEEQKSETSSRNSATILAIHPLIERLKDEYSESQLEEALIKHLEHFLLELGIGFTFVARQKRITLEGSHYRLDLLLYHRILRCLIAIDLKIGEFTHADAGQMNLYLNYLKDKEKLPNENDPVGLILCSDKKKTLVEYALGGMSNKIFASKYRLQLPDPEVLKDEIEHEKQKLLEMHIDNEMR